MKIGCHAVLFKERIKTETEEVLKGISVSGFKGVEIGSRFFGTGDKRDLLEYLKRYGIEISGMHIGCPINDIAEKEEEFIQKVLAVAEFVKDLPNKNVILSGSDATEEAFEAAAKNIEKAGQRCRNMGVTLHYHNHGWEFQNGAGRIHALARYAPVLKFGFDIGWIYKGGCEPVEILEKYADRIAYVHLRDVDNRADREFPDLGQGLLDYIKIMTALEKILGKDGWAIVEYETGAMDFHRYDAAMNFLHSLGH